MSPVKPSLQIIVVLRLCHVNDVSILNKYIINNMIKKNRHQQFNSMLKLLFLICVLLIMVKSLYIVFKSEDRIPAFSIHFNIYPLTSYVLKLCKLYNFIFGSHVSIFMELPYALLELSNSSVQLKCQTQLFHFSYNIYIVIFRMLYADFYYIYIPTYSVK